MAWPVLAQRFKNGLFSPHADEHRLKYVTFLSTSDMALEHGRQIIRENHPTVQVRFRRKENWIISDFGFLENWDQIVSPFLWQETSSYQRTLSPSDECQE